MRSAKSNVQRLQAQLINVARLRDKHYTLAKQQGFFVSNEGRKRAAISSIIRQAEAAEKYTPFAMARLVHLRLRSELEIIIPHYYSRYKTVRQSIQGMLTWCEREYRSTISKKQLSIEL